MQFSDNRAELFKALIEVRGKLKQPSKAGQANYGKFVTLDDMERAITEAEQGTGVTHLQEVTSTADTVSVKTFILHASGEYIEFDPLVLPTKQQNPQAFGSSATYARRYSLSAAYAIVANDDDDGNSATAGNGQQSASQRYNGRGRTQTPPPQQGGYTKSPQQSGPTPAQRIKSAVAAANRRLGDDKETITKMGFAQANLIYSRELLAQLTDAQTTSIVQAINAMTREGVTAQ